MIISVVKTTSGGEADNSRERILEIRAQYLKANPTAFKGNTRARSAYLNQLNTEKPSFTKFQRAYLVGLNLGDATVEINHSARTARLKMQQSVVRLAWMEHIREILLEYTASDKPLEPLKARPSMVELQTLMCRPIYELFVPLFYSSGSTRKSISPDIVKELNTVSVAAFFMGDGSKSDHTVNKGKGITFHSQGFNENETLILAEGMRRNLSLRCHAKLDDPKTNQWRLDVSGESYDDFVKKVGPFIHKQLHYRIPTGREAGSQFGNMTAEQRERCLGSALTDLKAIVLGY